MSADLLGILYAVISLLVLATEIQQLSAQAQPEDQLAPLDNNSHPNAAISISSLIFLRRFGASLPQLPPRIVTALTKNRNVFTKADDDTGPLSLQNYNDDLVESDLQTDDSSSGMLTSIQTLLKTRKMTTGANVLLEKPTSVSDPAGLRFSAEKRAGIFFPEGNKHVMPFNVAVSVGDPREAGSFTIRVPLEADMSVLDAFISATIMYRDNQTDQAEDNPFNLVLEWDWENRCYVIFRAMGIRNRRRYVWMFTVTDWLDEVVYHGKCLPGNDVILRPQAAVNVIYERVRRSQGNTDVVIL